MIALLIDLPECLNKIQDNYNSELYVVIFQDKDPNVYVIQSINKKGPRDTVNRLKLFDLKKSQEDPLLVDPSIGVPNFDLKMCKNQNPRIDHPYGIRSKTKKTLVSGNSVKTEPQNEPKGGLGWASRSAPLLVPLRMPQ